jgi:Oligosaccharyltransferase 48 kDa subunit beta
MHGREWEPAIVSDLQMEWVMMAPYIRKTMLPFQTCAELPPMQYYNGTEAFIQTTMPCLLDQLSPDIRATTQAYYVQVQIPDRVGVFKLRLSHDYPGFSPILIEEPIVVRPYSHSEYPRLLTASLPYYIVLLSMLLGGFMFAAVFLYYRGNSQPKHRLLK